MTGAKKDIILEALARDPGARNADIARALGPDVSPAYVSTVRQRHKAAVARQARKISTSQTPRAEVRVPAAEPDCRACKDRGWIIHVYRERAPRPAYWFQRGPNGERPHVCTCGVIGGDR